MVIDWDVEEVELLCVSFSSVSEYMPLLSIGCVCMGGGLHLLFIVTTQDDHIFWEQVVDE